jgi:CTP:molybdopterin cytidylyltransferase MocA
MQIARRRGLKKAIVALARRLAVIMHRIWVDGTEFRWTREQAATAGCAASVITARWSRSRQ